MSVINDTWRFLLQRRLWPVAILLVAAAVAVPKLLAKEPTAAAVAPAVAVKSDRASVLATEPIVAPAEDGDRSGRRHVLGSSKNPFKPKVTPTPVATPDTVSTTGATTGAPTGPGVSPLTDSTGLTKGATGPGGTTVGASPVVPGVTTPAPAKKKYELNELTVRFGPSDGTRPPRHDVKRLQALPSNDEPVLIYLGVLEDKKTAVFLVDSGIIAQGDGTCRPSRTTCETIHIREGETEFFDVAGEPTTDGTTAAPAAQYQLDVLRIRKKVTTSAKKAKQSIARVSKSGQKIVRARIMGDGPLRYRFNKKTGRLEKLSRKAYKAVVAKAAHAARAGF
jgi:hypothetical protein